MISKLEDILTKDEKLVSRYPRRWLAIKILERDREVLRKIASSPIRDEVEEILR